MTIQQPTGSTGADSNLFTTVRYLPGATKDGSVTNAALCLTRPDNRTINERATHINLAPLDILDDATTRFLGQLIRRRMVAEVAFQSRVGLLAVVLYLPNGESNPALALLNHILGFMGEEPMLWVEVAHLAGLGQHEVGRIDDNTPRGCLLANQTERLLLETVNRYIIGAGSEPSPR